MAKTYLVMLVLVILILPGFAFASNCAATAYRNSCSSCPVDANGKMNKTCYDGYQSTGVGCVAAAHPLAMTQYQQGKCPQIQSCIDELNTCKSQYSTGNDSADCKEGSVAVCFTSADNCVDQAASGCGEKLTGCPTSAMVMGLVLAGAIFVSMRR